MIEPEDEALDLLKTDPARWIKTATVGEARRVKEALAAYRIHLELERLALDWIRVDDAVAEADKALAALRARLIAVPGAVCQQANPNDPTLAYREFMRGLNEALAEISGQQIADAGVAKRAADEAKPTRGRPRKSAHGR
jgi:hypothetical protein